MGKVRLRYTISVELEYELGVDGFQGIETPEEARALEEENLEEHWPLYFDGADFQTSVEVVDPLYRRASIS